MYLISNQSSTRKSSLNLFLTEEYFYRLSSNVSFHIVTDLKLRNFSAIGHLSIPTWSSPAKRKAEAFTNYTRIGPSGYSYYIKINQYLHHL